MRDNLKLKVIFGFTIASLALFAALYVTITNFYRLKDSIEELTMPDKKVQRLTKMMDDIQETERIVRLYTLTDDEVFLKELSKYTENIQSELDTIKSKSNQETEQYTLIDSVENLWQSRTVLFDEFIALKEKQQGISLASEAMNRISSEALDTAKVKTTTTTKKVEVANKKTIPHATEQEQLGEEPDKEGLFKMIKQMAKQIFSKKQTPSQDQPKNDSLNTFTETYVTYDTVITEADAQQIWDAVMNVLDEYRKKENLLQINQSKAEFQLLQKEAEIMDKIRSMIKNLQVVEIARAQQNSIESKTMAQRSILTILIIGLGGLFVSIVFISLILNDITRSNYYKSRLEASKKRAEKLAKAKEEFLANMSHEIRTPLSAILGFTEQLLGSDLQEKHRFYLQAVKNSSDHLLSTVNDILDYSKIEAGQFTLEQVPFRISDEIREVCETLNLKASEKNIDLSYVVDEDLKYVVLGDAFRLKQILINLVGNAIKFTEEGYVRIVGTKIIKDTKSIWVKLAVEDSGIGISKDKIKSIFRDFSQADTTITRKYGGTGLGLAITKKLILLHNGKIYVDSEPGKGSVFTIEIKYTLGEEASLIDTSQQNVVTARFDNKKVLVVDDDEYNLLLFHTILKKWGMKTDMASNGKEGMDLIKQKTYDLILSDIHMPEKSGMELVDETRKDTLNKNTPILAITANVMKQDIDSYLKAGFDDFVLKPFKEKELFQKISHAWKIKLSTDDKEEPEEQENTSHPENKEKATFSLFDIERFAEGDPKAMMAILRGLIDNNRMNIFQMHEFAVGKKWVELGKVAHKMLPSYNHLKAFSVVSALRKIEDIVNRKKGYNQITPLLEHIKSVSKDIFAALEERIHFYTNKENKEEEVKGV